MRMDYNSKTKSFSLVNLTENEANAILRALGIIVEKMDYSNELGFYIDSGDCFALPVESYEAASKLYNELQGK